MHSWLQRLAYVSGGYEASTVHFLIKVRESVGKPGCVLDVGANIGTMSIPILKSKNDLNVISVECSPSTYPFLQRTHSFSNFRSRWKLDNRAAAIVDGQLQFYTSGPDAGAFDGLRDTGRGGVKVVVTVECAPLDKIWNDHGNPSVSVLKIDIEGGEFEAIMSANELILKNKPAIIFEWSVKNLEAFGRDPKSIFEILDKYPGEIISLPTMHTVTKYNLELLMTRCEMFILVVA